uniref:cold-responsive protein kinase 1-like n=1 Tax=Erigeron canadensis TaxID=72917 RepID=UPI001CB8E129|nr:cold-responsive protein kinase 1-like [Erigeron canadensis]
MEASVVVVIILMNAFAFGSSQSNNQNGNTVIRLSCGSNPAMSSSSFFSNLNSTIDQLRSQLSNNGVYFARAQNSRNQDSVYGLAQCRNYLSVSQCVACFDVAVSAVQTCPAVNGANVFLDNCFLRYENFDEFYSNPQTIMDVGVAPTAICGNQSSSEPSTFNTTVQELLSGVMAATPRTSDFYVASTRQDSSSNATVYAIAQCVLNTSQDVCQNCINTAYNNLYTCIPLTQGRTIDLGCYMRYSETPFFRDNQTTNIIPFLNEGSSSKPGMIAGISAGVTAFFLILALSLWYKLRKKPEINEDASPLQGLKNYKYTDLQSATHNFSKEYRIGKGGYGEVFKAVLDNENAVAVKKLYVEYGKAKMEFDNEINLISNVRHRNLMQLLGWSSNGSELLLVLEYMPQGSLDQFLWGEKRGTLNWRHRFDIIFGIAKGLVHLHEEFHVKIVHRDIKSSNVLLDNDFQPKIADFGLARFQPGDESHVSTRFAGTLGYTAPEYATFGRLSEKVDTYSFGIVVLEIISGQKCTDVNSDEQGDTYLLEHAWTLYEEGLHMNLIDETLDSKEHKEDIMKIIEIALLCTQSPVSSRPTMSEVVLMLSVGPSFRPKPMTKPTLIETERRIK